MGTTKNRKHRKLPTIARCPFELCVYNRNGVCEDVPIHKANSDSDCHAWAKSLLLENLEEYTE